MPCERFAKMSQVKRHATTSSLGPPYSGRPVCLSPCILQFFVLIRVGAQIQCIVKRNPPPPSLSLAAPVATAGKPLHVVELLLLNIMRLFHDRWKRFSDMQLCFVSGGS